jgi:hypothetical protein
VRIVVADDATITPEGLVVAKAIRSPHPGVAVLLRFSHTDAGYATQPLHDQPARAGCLLKARVFDVPVLVDAPWRFAKGASGADR